MNFSKLEFVKLLLVFLFANITLRIIGFQLGGWGILFSITVFYSAISFVLPEIQFENQLFKFAYTLLFSLISVLIFSDSDLMRGLDLGMLLFSICLASPILYSEQNSRLFLLRSAIAVSASQSIYSIFVEYLRNPGFLSLLNKTQILVTLALIIYFIYQNNKHSSTGFNFIRDIPLWISLGSLLVILKSKRTDFPWDSSIWQILVWSTSFFLFLWFLTTKKEVMSNSINFTIKKSHLIFTCVGLSSYFLLPGLFEYQETRKHVVYHLGLFNLLSENVIENGPLNRCTGINLPEGSSGVEIGEPGGCWVYPTGWWSLPVWTLLPFLLLGFDGIQSARFLSFILRAISAILIGLIVRKYSANNSSQLIAVISFLTCTQVSHYGRVYTWQQFEDIFILVGIFLWSPILLSKAEPEINDVRNLAIYCASGSIILGFGASAISCYFALTIFLFSKYSKKVRLAFFSIILLFSINSWFIWKKALEYFFNSSNAAEEQIFWKINYRSSRGELLISPDYYLELFSQSAFLLGPILCIGFLATISQIFSIVKSRDFLNENNTIILIFSPFLFLWLVVSILFPQSGFSHDYLAFWTLAPALSAIVADYISQINKRVVISSFVCLLFVSFNELAYYEDRIHDPDMVPLHSWIYENIDDEDDVLLSHDLYKEHYIAAITGRNIHHYYQSSDSEIIHAIVVSEDIDVILTNSTGWQNWDLQDHLSEEWCFEEFKGSDYTYFGAARCAH